MSNVVRVLLYSGAGGILGALLAVFIVWLTHPGGTQSELAGGFYTMLGLAVGGWVALKKEQS